MYFTVFAEMNLVPLGIGIQPTSLTWQPMFGVPFTHMVMAAVQHTHTNEAYFVCYMFEYSFIEHKNLAVQNMRMKCSLPWMDIMYLGSFTGITTPNLQHCLYL